MEEDLINFIVTKSSIFLVSHLNLFSFGGPSKEKFVILAILVNECEVKHIADIAVVRVQL